MPRHASECFETELRQRIDYFRREYLLTYAECVGVLELLKNEVINEALGTDKDEDDE